MTYCKAVLKYKAKLQAYADPRLRLSARMLDAMAKQTIFLRRGDVEKLIVNDTITMAFKHRALQCAHKHGEGDDDKHHHAHPPKHAKGDKSRGSNSLPRAAAKVAVKPGGQGRNISTLKDSKKQRTGVSNLSSHRNSREHGHDHSHTEYSSVEMPSNLMLNAVDEEDPLADLVNQLKATGLRAPDPEYIPGLKVLVSYMQKALQMSIEASAQ